MKIRLPIAIIASLFVIAFPLHAEDHNGIVDRLLRPLRAGTSIELKSTPAFLQRVFLPTLPEKENTLKIDDDAIDTIVDASFKRRWPCSRDARSRGAFSLPLGPCRSGTPW